MEAPTADGEWLDEQPCVALVDEPRIRVELRANRCRLSIDVEELALNEHGPASAAIGVVAVDLERDGAERLVDHVARTGSHRDPCARRDSGAADESKVDWQHHGIPVADEPDPTDHRGGQKGEAFVL